MSRSQANQKAVLTNQLVDGDGFYETLLDAHTGLTHEQSALLHAKLVLLLANQIGNPAVLAQCIALARQNLPETAISAT
jgi:Protein of unknown function (DUF2783)